MRKGRGEDHNSADGLLGGLGGAAESLMPCHSQSCLCVGNSVWGKAAGTLVNWDFI